jgi:hypothetical protein
MELANNPDNQTIHSDLCGVAAALNDESGMQRELQWAASKPLGAVGTLGYAAVGRMAYLGKFKKAHELSAQALRVAKENNFKDVAAGIAARNPFMNFKPHDQQQQFGMTLGGPIRRNRVFFFAGFDQHIFHIPAVVRFLNGGSVVTPLATLNSAFPGDYEPSDQALVFVTASQLSKQAGTYPASMLGNAGFLKLDISLSQHNHLSARLSTSRYYGHNNVFLDTASPLTSYGVSENGEEDVHTETGTISLTSNLSFRLISHLRAQLSRDLQDSSSNSSEPITRIPTIIDGFGRSSILPRQTREHRAHFAETISLDGKRPSWKFGGDALLTWIYNYFPSLFGGEYIFDPIKVDPFTFEPVEGGLELTPLRAYAHQVPHYYLQSFGSAVTHPDTNEYAGFARTQFALTIISRSAWGHATICRRSAQKG